MQRGRHDRSSILVAGIGFSRGRCRCCEINSFSRVIEGAPVLARDGYGVNGTKGTKLWMDELGVGSCTLGLANPN